MSQSNIFADWSDDELAQELAHRAEQVESAGMRAGSASVDEACEKAARLMREASQRLADA